MKKSTGNSILVALGIAAFTLADNPLFAQQGNMFQVNTERQHYYRSLLERNKDVVKFIEHTLISNGLPKMLRNLAMIESSFVRQSVSHANAGGIWQFTVGHGNQFGLSDQERFDVYKSTQVAATSLKQMYSKYNNWIAVVAAYNCGEGNVDKAMAVAKSNQYHDYAAYLPAETKGHVRKFMEACQATGELDLLKADYRMAGFNTKMSRVKTTKRKVDLSLASEAINGAFDPDVIAEVLAINSADFDKWNPYLKEELLEQGTATLYLPVDLMPDFQLQKNLILSRSLQKPLD